ncbi:hemerythrin domain-containing protein [Nocardioides houyundeii]|uniref:hemerythrin domain-containing protein n=1 Tax=Nocardioides houyundeii TaxID=2045452 RepID=UPI000C76705E|nr:hemerythrin domain-containing protein [Nocardioides houyundeii]
MTTLSDPEHLHLNRSVVEHRPGLDVELSTLLARLPRAPGHDQDEALGAFRRALSWKLLLADQILWPVARRTVPFGEALVLQAHQEHAELAELLARLEAGSVTATQWDRVRDRLVELCQALERDEQDVLLPALGKHLGARLLSGLGLVTLAAGLLERNQARLRLPVLQRSPRSADGATLTMALCPDC